MTRMYFVMADGVVEHWADSEEEALTFAQDYVEDEEHEEFPASLVQVFEGREVKRYER